MLPVAEGDNFQRKNEIIHFRRSLDRIKFGLIRSTAPNPDLRRLSTIRRSSIVRKKSPCKKNVLRYKKSD